MSEELILDTALDAEPGAAARLTPLVRRVLAPNPGPFTFKGTCSYIVGQGRVAIVDPGPDRAEHVEALLQAVAGETVTHIVVTHTHKDHSPAARAVQAATGAPVVGCGPHRAARALTIAETQVLDSSGDREHRPDHLMTDGDVLDGPGWTLEAIETPGHTANHLCFALREENALFSGDHVMAWSTSIVAPPDGSMRDYMASLDRMRERGEAVYWPGHGGPVREPQRFVRALGHHRRQREASILNRLAAGDRTIPALVEAIYKGLALALRPAAGLSVLAHLEDLVERGLVTAGEGVTLDGTYRPAG